MQGITDRVEEGISLGKEKWKKIREAFIEKMTDLNLEDLALKISFLQRSLTAKTNHS